MAQETNWEGQAENLLKELLTAKETYGKLQNLEVYKELKKSFKEKEKLYSKFSKKLIVELYDYKQTVTTEKNLTEDCIFEPVKYTLMNGEMTNDEVKQLLRKKRVTLVELYDEVLANANLPASLRTVIDSQKKELQQ
ncbi:hypothetical protein [Allomuricauda sp. d1]|uniref:hypothetical protein n=1 Tax=Allomuricauda sp. d1 TaxID=3136725 RepID=UPI0031DA0056